MSGVWTALLLLLLNAQSAASLSVRVASATQLYGALFNASVTEVVLSSSLVLVAAEWPRIVEVTRSVNITASAQLRAAKVHPRLDFRNLAMLVHLAPGTTLAFQGLEVLNHIDTIGPAARFIRTSVGATLKWEDCIMRKRAGWSVEASVLNLLAAPRPEDEPGPQAGWVVAPFSYLSTASAALISFPKAIIVIDYRTTIPIDTTLAFQGLYMGGYKQIGTFVFYIVENVASEDCLKERSGVECVTLLVKQLEQQDAVAAATVSGSRGDSGGDNTNTTTVGE